MKKLWLRWTALFVVVLLLGGLFVRLGEWQLHRLTWRRGVNAQVVAHQKAPVKPYQEVFTPGRTITDAEQWQRVSVTGTFDQDPAHQVQALYRELSNSHGSEVVTPLRTTRGEWLLVDRGFLVKPAGGQEVAVLPAPPKGEVRITGWVRRNEEGKPSATTPTTDGLVQLINAPQIGRHLGRPVLDGYIGIKTISQPQDGDLKPMATPELDEGPHLSYALQWFCFTAIAVTGLVILVRTDLKDRRKQQLKAERAAQRAAAQAAPPAGDGATAMTDVTEGK